MRTELGTHRGVSKSASVRVKLAENVGVRLHKVRSLPKVGAEVDGVTCFKARSSGIRSHSYSGTLTCCLLHLLLITYVPHHLCVLHHPSSQT